MKFQQSKILRQRNTGDTLSGIVSDLQQHLNGQAGSFASQKIARAVLSIESLDVADQRELSTAMEGLHAVLNQVAQTHNLKSSFTQAQRDAAAAAGIIASDIPGHLRYQAPQVLAEEGLVIIHESPAVIAAGGSVDRIRPALEAYDERDNKSAPVYTVAYNMQASRQDEFGEAFFPTITVSPEQAGIAVSIRLVTVYNDIRRAITGAVEDWKRRNIIRAVIDHTILRNDTTKVVPVYRDESKDKFVDPAVLLPYDTLVMDETITTSALAMGKELSLISISQTDALLETGLMDISDTLDQAMNLETLFLKVVDPTDPTAFEVVRFNVSRLPYSNFTYSPQGNYRLNQLMFRTDILKLDKNTKLVDGSISTLLDFIKTNELTVRLSVTVSGTCNLEYSNMTVFTNQLSLKKVFNAGGAELAPSDATYIQVNELVEKMEMVGYEVSARRTNMNRRQRGQLLNTDWNTQIYNVPLLPPITIPRPLSAGDQNDTSDLAGLITATRIATSNAAVTELQRVEEVLEDFVSDADASIDTPAILGTGRYLVKPFFERHVIDMTTDLDSLSSGDRRDDIQALLVNKLRDISYRMYRDTGYKAAADAMAGGIAPLPVILMGTDPVTGGYINVNGDQRTLGNGLNYNLVTSLDDRITGKIYLTLGVAEGQEGIANPMHFGNMAWKPETTMVLPMPRNGGISKELTVQPSYLHVNHSPILAVIEVRGIENVAGSKVTVNVSQ